MANKIVIASGKGGVGKSTLTAGLGRTAAGKGIKTLLIDCDAGLGSLDILLGCDKDCTFNWMDVYEERCKAEDALIGVCDNLSLLPVPRSAETDYPEDAIKSFLDKHESEYDLIFIDAPAGIDNGVKRAAMGADRAIVVATPDTVSVRGAWTVARVLLQNGIKEARLVINRFDYRSVRRKKQFNIDDTIDQTAVQLLGVVPEESKIISASVTGKQLKKNSPAAKAFDRILQRIYGANVPLRISYFK
ncbi:MAG: AAA family ATPase [Clostridia bacterium]|nr:AAA family ATPase [Clostridia bacterium]MBR6781260.1 AAA family ATPase [Clostridia bacterium]